MTVETDWPAVCSGVSLSQPAIPASVAGQQTWVTDLKNTVAAFSSGKGVGISYWEPAWLNNANLGSGCSVSFSLK